MKTKLFTLLLAVAIIFQACDTKKKSNNEEMSHDDTEMHDHEHMGDDHSHDNDHMDSTSEEMEENKLEASAVSKEQLESMLSSYFSLKDALVNTSAKDAKEAASALVKNLTDEMSNLKSLVAGMQEKEDVEAIRADFEKLSSSMYQVVKANPDKVENAVYKQYCPMAFNNKGAFWLSQEETIMNPYFGDKMLKCGKVQEEL